MREEIFAALSQGATLVTATPRLARSLSHEFGTAQLASGRKAWRTPDIHGWNIFLSRLWDERKNEGQAPPLTSAQEQALWESIIEGSPEAASLIQPQAAARLAGEAWRLVQDWRLPLTTGPKQTARGAWESTAETATFYGWAQQFQFHTRWLDRMDPARLTEILLEGGVTGPRELYVAGFDEHTPRQLALLSALEKAGTNLVRIATAPPEINSASCKASLASFGDSAAEIAVCAEWCRRRLEANPSARIGVVVADLEERRHRFERAFRLTAPGAFHIALGPPLSARPMVAAALRLLEFGAGRVNWDAVSSLLLSPWVAGFADERGRRAGCEVQLRRSRSSEFAPEALRRHEACPPILSRALHKIEAVRLQWPEEQKPGAWSIAFAGVLDAFGWPGDEPVHDDNFQVLEAWRGILSELAATDVTRAAVSRERAFGLLRSLARDKRFEVESAGEPIQIMGTAESAGLLFDHLWIAGMTDEIWPARPRPNPFVPLSLQRQFNLPHSTPARELEFASRIAQRLVASAGEVVVSYAKADTEREMAPSPMFSSLPAWQAPETELHESFVAAPAAFERILDSIAPPVPDGSLTTGGTRALEMQAKCPFRAFAEIRLGARELDLPEPGLDPRERGGFLHSALEIFWKRLPSSRALKDASEEAVAAAIEESVDYALTARRAADDDLTEKLLALEKLRLTELLQSWIELEKRREVEFSVEAPEQERTVQIGGLTVQLRLDRLDKLSTGSYALIDYKSRAPRLGDWDGERPESPQIPIYAVTAREPLTAIAFAQVRTGENGFKGYSTLAGALPGTKPSEPTELAARIDEWRRVLTALGENFRGGRAEVDPKDQFKTCDLCHLPALCRVAER